jgi:putative transcriptional regulator
MSDHEKASMYDRLMKGMKESIAYSKGELSLVTIKLPAPPPAAKPHRIASLRKQCRMSQAVFAAVVNVSVKTVQSWEHGSREPSHAALRMLQIIERKPDVLDMILASPAPVTTGKHVNPRKSSRREKLVG